MQLHQAKKRKQEEIKRRQGKNYEMLLSRTKGGWMAAMVNVPICAMPTWVVQTWAMPICAMPTWSMLAWVMPICAMPSWAMLTWAILFLMKELRFTRYNAQRKAVLSAIKKLMVTLLNLKSLRTQNDQVQRAVNVGVARQRCYLSPQLMEAKK